MSRVFFISSNVTVDPYPVYPLGMAVVSGAVKAAGHEVEQYDCLVNGDDIEKLRSRITTFMPDLISISLRNIDNVDSFSGEDAWYLARVKTLVAAIREFCPAPIVVGGPALTIMPEEIASYLEVDHAIIGEGEVALPQLVEKLARGEQVPQVIERAAPLDGNAFSTPLFDPELAPFYLEQSGMLNLQTKRGCPYRCTYCSYPHLEGNSFRRRDPELVIRELKSLKEKHGVERIFFTDSVFNDPQGEYLKLCEAMIRNDIGIEWSAYFRPQGFGRDELQLMKRAGLYALELGPDAGCDRTLAGLDKKLTFAEVLAINEACLAERMAAAHFVIFGGPEEDDDTLAEGLDNMDRLGASVVFGFSGIRIHPDSPLHQRAIDDGVITAETSLLKPVYYFSPKIDREKMEATIKTRFHGQKNRIFPPSEGTIRLEVMKNFGLRGLMWNSLVRFPKEGSA
ncbi:MAG: lipid biosynthesis B12-binding/radical SAM protein [Desulfuromonas sp.]|nr:MAG: lipid biosynthesis B12-binding/radical SAM protein [Desulfuromonas sp.]